MKKTSTAVLFALTACSLVAQPLGFGIKGGVPLTDVIESGPSGVLNVETQRYIFGPMVELRLPAGLAIEADALYSRVNFSSALGAAGSVISSVTDSNSWEFPILLKKKFGGARTIGSSIRPYVEAGVSFRRLSLPSYLTGDQNGAADPNNKGFVAGGGVEFKILFLRISPEIRFTRWGDDNFRSGLANVILKTNRNQGQFLVGFSF
ncbi:MAG: outer membrane beta-barrel protein [Bryobacteraceae bacterium]|nr:outer membrane beta-barrel protein [Bryobacteraceae bacterium]